MDTGEYLLGVRRPDNDGKGERAVAAIVGYTNQRVSIQDRNVLLSA
jgi:hypothetical protein